HIDNAFESPFVVLVKNPPDSSVGSINNLTTLILYDNQITTVIICNSLRDAYPQIFNLLKRYHNRLGINLDQKWMSPVGEFASPGLWNYELDSMTIESEADTTLSLLMYQLVESYVRSEQTMGNVFPNHLLSLKSPKTPTTLFK
ncbi:hypothetical protein QUB52_27735, partial [Microcoleus sp. A6-C6]